VTRIVPPIPYRAVRRLKRTYGGVTGVTGGTAARVENDCRLTCFEV